MIQNTHPSEYANFLEKKIINESFWKISNFSETMIIDEKNISSKIFSYFYSLFLPIYLEYTKNNTVLKKNYTNFSIYLINHFENKETVKLFFNNSPKIIYFVNNVDSKIFLKETLIDLSSKKGTSILTNNISEINFIRSHKNIQTCIAILHLNPDKNVENLKYY